jgi:hypothetical protein
LASLEDALDRGLRAHWRNHWRALRCTAPKALRLQEFSQRCTPLPKPRALFRFRPGASHCSGQIIDRTKRPGQVAPLAKRAQSSAAAQAVQRADVDLDELMDELHRLEGTHVGVSSTALALYVVGTLRVGVARTFAIPEGTVVLADELLASLPAEPTDDLKGFHVGDSATVMIIPGWFVSAQVTEHGIEIEMEHESLSLTTFNPGPPYAPQIIELG